MRKLIFKFIFLSSISTVGYAQQFSLNQKLLIHVGYSTIKSNTFIRPNFGYLMGGQPNSKFSAELGYKVFPALSLSGYIASSQIKVNQYQVVDNNSIINLVKSKKSNFYGLNARLHCLPLFFKERKMKIDFYMIGSVGTVSTYTNELISEEWQQVYEKSFWERGAGLGLSYNFTKNIGIFGEYQLGRFYNDQKSQWKAGVLVTL